MLRSLRYSGAHHRGKLGGGEGEELACAAGDEQAGGLVREQPGDVLLVRLGLEIELIVEMRDWKREQACSHFFCHFLRVSSSGRCLLHECFEQGVEAVGVIDEQAMAGIFKDFSLPARHGRGNQLRRRAIVCGHDGKHRDVELGQHGTFVILEGELADQGDPRAGGGFERCFDYALEVLLRMRLVIHAADKGLCVLPAGRTERCETVRNGG